MPHVHWILDGLVMDGLWTGYGRVMDGFTLALTLLCSRFVILRCVR